MMVAEARGASFIWEPRWELRGASVRWELFQGSLIAMPVAPSAWDVFEEVVGWLGFSNGNRYLDGNCYLDSLQLEREAIFNRAKY